MSNPNGIEEPENGLQPGDPRSRFARGLDQPRAANCSHGNSNHGNSSHGNSSHGNSSRDRIGHPGHHVCGTDVRLVGRWNAERHAIVTAHRIELFVFEDNAYRTYVKTGFVEEGLVRDLHRDADGNFRSMRLMSLLRPESVARP